MLNDFIKAMGAMAESMRLLRDELIKNGFTRREAVKLTEAFMVQTLSLSQNNKMEDI